MTTLDASDAVDRARRRVLAGMVVATTASTPPWLSEAARAPVAGGASFPHQEFIP
ncbi:hypothetical protein [Frateuria defendens]|uniref:hypothetical protein n=1 Tax=Frateuria defendens TaxID=2219559 RepID=UPI0012930285|nr:hypothetical protein [Frateuria defendens]